jgi:4-amino-4-deoxy-L-arabinose transferase-like glycosyltransferase
MTRFVFGDMTLALFRFDAPIGADSGYVVRASLWLAMAAVGVWVMTGIGTSTGQWGDHFEQFVWQHSVEWGYHKHPPLPTWMLAATTRLFGLWTGWAHVLAALCTLATAFFTHRVARMLLGPPLAALALLLWGLQAAFSARAHLFNHNTVLMLAVSATAWATLHALASRRHATLWWLAAGIAGGLAMLAKYQAVVPLTGLVLAASLSGELASRPARRGVLLAAMISGLVFAPHVLWVASHRFSSLDYAMQAGRTLDWPERAWSMTSFLAQQIRLSLPALLLVALLAMLPGRLAASTFAQDAPERRRIRAWLFGLIGFPLLVTLLTCPLFGLELQNHWGYQALQFAGLWLAWRVRPLAPSAGPAWIILTVALHAIFLTIAIVTVGPVVGDVTRRLDSRYPAQEIADAVRRDWKDVTLCPLALVVGPTFEAGMIALYGGDGARVLEDGDFSKSPWISVEDVARTGAVYVATDLHALPTEGVALVTTFDVSAVTPAPKTHIYWAIVPPETCSAEVRPGE